MQASHAEPFSRHSNVTPGSGEVNVSVAENSVVVPLGPPVIVVSGTSCSTVQVRWAGVASVLPTASVARTSNVCEPEREAGQRDGGGAGRPGAAVEAALERGVLVGGELDLRGRWPSSCRTGPR